MYFVFILSLKNVQEIKYHERNSYKKGACLSTLQAVIVSMINELEKKKKIDDRSQNHSENSKIIGRIVFWSVQLTAPVY